MKFDRSLLHVVDEGDGFCITYGGYYVVTVNQYGICLHKHIAQNDVFFKLNEKGQIQVYDNNDLLKMLKETIENVKSAR